MKIQSPWMGRVRGSAGQMTGAKVYDKNVMRAKAFEVNNPNTQSQQTERSFFAQVQKVVASVSEEELRSLFGIKPKAMSRRNALSKQVAAAFSIDGTTKSVDFSKLQAIGNGEKVTTQLVKIANGDFRNVPDVSMDQFGSKANENTNCILVAFDEDTERIVVVALEDELKYLASYADIIPGNYGVQNGYGYLTCATDGSNVYEQPIGSFTIKTRAYSKSQPSPEPTPTITIYAGGTEAESFAHFNSDEFDNEEGKVPSQVLQDGTSILDAPQWDEVNNWWFGNTVNDVDPDLPLEIVGTQDGQEFGTFQATWVVQ